MGPDAVVYPEQCLVGFVFSELPLDLAGKHQISLLAYPKCWVTVNCGQLWVVQADTDQIVQCSVSTFYFMNFDIDYQQIIKLL